LISVAIVTPSPSTRCAAPSISSMIHGSRWSAITLATPFSWYVEMSTSPILKPATARASASAAPITSTTVACSCARYFGS
jgi:hypothetical protein